MFSLSTATIADRTLFECINDILIEISNDQTGHDNTTSASG